MPTYDYECDACGHRFEEFQSMKEEPLRKCPQCKKNKLRRLIGTGAAILFKGSGFYQTDYRSDTYKSAAKADEKVGSGGTTDTPKKTDTNGTANGSAASGGKASEKSSKS
jgi:putative FmdB family regulatory protein